MIIGFTKAVLQNLYISVGAACLTTFLASICLLYRKDSGSWKKVIDKWIYELKNNNYFLITILYLFCVFNILFRTILCRQFWVNPLSNVVGNWHLLNEDGQINAELLGNIFMFIPFSALCAWRYHTKKQEKNISYIFLYAILASALFSCLIECVQFFFKLGTLQLSDLIFNTLGGLLGSLIYLFIFRLMVLIKKNRKKESH